MVGAIRCDSPESIGEGDDVLHKHKQPLPEECHTDSNSELRVHCAENSMVSRRVTVRQHASLNCNRDKKSSALRTLLLWIVVLIPVAVLTPWLGFEVGIASSVTLGIFVATYALLSKVISKNYEPWGGKSVSEVQAPNDVRV
jgi:hypothetical protein